jgi:CBS domain-containing protein
MRSLLVRDLMTSPVLTIRPHTRLPMVKQIMCEHGVHRLPVVEHGRLLGIITLGDVRNAFPSDVPLLQPSPAPRLDAIRAEHLMRTEVITIAPEAAVTTAAALLVRQKVNGLPVVAGQRVIGIITKSDLCRAVLEGKLVTAPSTLLPLQELGLVAHAEFPPEAAHALLERVR